MIRPLRTRVMSSMLIAMLAVAGISTPAAASSSSHTSATAAAHMEVKDSGGNVVCSAYDTTATIRITATNCPTGEHTEQLFDTNWNQISQRTVTIGSSSTAATVPANSTPVASNPTATETASSSTTVWHTSPLAAVHMEVKDSSGNVVCSAYDTPPTIRVTAANCPTGQHTEQLFDTNWHQISQRNINVTAGSDGVVTSFLRSANVDHSNLPSKYTEVGPGDPVPTSSGPVDIPNMDSSPDNYFVPDLPFSDPFHVVTVPSLAPEGVTAQDLVQALNETGLHPPHPVNSDLEFVPGQASSSFAGPGWVTTTAIFDQEGNQIGVRNETTLAHALHPGVVERYVVVSPSGRLGIETRGWGTGNFEILNTLLAGITWTTLDTYVYDRAEELADEREAEESSSPAPGSTEEINKEYTGDPDNNEGEFGFADADRDGVPDDQDDYPNDNSRHDFNDRDGDGVPNNRDDFPNDPNRSEESNNNYQEFETNNSGNNWGWGNESCGEFC